MKKLFLVGCPRSGTTLLQQALDRHGDIAIPPETRFFVDLVGHTRMGQLRQLQQINADLKPAYPVLQQSEMNTLGSTSSTLSAWPRS